MHPSSSRTVPAEKLTLGQLCIGADWACANGDIGTLGHLATRLAVFARGEPLHCKLIVLAEMCSSDPDNAVAAWLRLREQLLAACR